MRLLIIVALMASACAPIQYQIEPSAMPYVERWEELYNIAVELNVKLAPIGPAIVGLCRQGGGDREVTLDAWYWEAADDAERESLIFHEFGHCLMGLGHDRRLASVDGWTIPASIMYPYVFDGSIYEYHKEYYREELRHSRASERP